MCTFNEIKKANESIVTTDIKGKEYAEVNQRIKAFRMVHPEGCIETEIISLTDGVVTFKATIYDREGRKLSTGYAQEKETSSFINKTSFIENCETSAVGRALGMCGFGIDTSVASFEEVSNAINNQESKDSGEMLTDKQREVLLKLNIDQIKNILNHFNVESVSELTKAQAAETIKRLIKKREQ